MKYILGVLSLLSAVSIAAVKLEPVLTSGIESPIYVAFAPGEPANMYVVEQKGRIKIYDRTKGTFTTLLDISQKVTFGGEMGLLGLAFHPKYATNGRYFVNYTHERPELTSFISEFKRGTSAEKSVMRYDQPYSNHNGGQVAFDSQGYLYIGVGDGGSAGDPHGHGQNRSSLLGKILRIDIDTGFPYGIPKDNPFLDGKSRPEIYAYGLRNPWRFSFDRQTGALWVADVGQDKLEEIDVVEKGGNYGWNTMEGNQCFKPSVNCQMAGLALPVFQYGRSQGNSITGGYVYRGTKIPELVGKYVYGDYGSGKIWALSVENGNRATAKNELLLNTRLPISSFGEDEEGEIYMVNYQGKIYRLSPA